MKDIIKHLTMAAGALALITGGYLVYTHCCIKTESEAVKIQGAGVRHERRSNRR